MTNLEALALIELPLIPLSAWLAWALVRRSKKIDAPGERQEGLTDNITSRVYSGGITAAQQAAHQAAENDRNRQIDLIESLQQYFLRFIVEAIEIDSRETINIPTMERRLRNEIGPERFRTFDDAVNNILGSRTQYKESLQARRNEIQELEQKGQGGLVDIGILKIENSIKDTLNTHILNCVAHVRPVIENALAFPERPQPPDMYEHDSDSPGGEEE